MDTVIGFSLRLQFQLQLCTGAEVKILNILLDLLVTK